MGANKSGNGPKSIVPIFTELLTIAVILEVSFWIFIHLVTNNAIKKLIAV
jgi:hypothetical protein